jgi:hypothetical protein
MPESLCCARDRCDFTPAMERTLVLLVEDNRVHFFDD